MRPAGRILVVDDDPAIRDAVQAMVRTEEVQIRLASTGREALRIAASFRPEAVVQEADLPDVDGLALCRELKDREYADRVIVVSGRDSFEDEYEALVCGADAYLRKPFSPLVLLGLLTGDEATP